MRYLALLAILIGSIAASPAPYVRQHIVGSSVRIKMDDVEVKLGCKHSCVEIYTFICSGVIVGAKDTLRTKLEILTAAHCVAPSFEDGVGEFPILSTITAYTHGGDIGHLISSHADVRHDVAIATFAFRRSHIISAAIYRRSLEIKQRLYAFGNPLAGDWLMQDANYGGADPALVDYPIWRHDRAALCALCSEGDSGGGVWTDRGYLVGIMNAAGIGIIDYLPIAQALHYTQTH